MDVRDLSPTNPDILNNRFIYPSITAPFTIVQGAKQGRETSIGAAQIPSAFGTRRKNTTLNIFVEKI